MPFKISVKKFNVLRILHGAKGKLAVQVVKNRMIEKTANTTRLMDKLCAKNLIHRVRCVNDRRVVYVEISESGLKMLNEIKMEDSEDVIAKLSQEELVELNRLLDKIRGF